MREINWFCRIAMAGTRVALQDENLIRLLTQNRFAAVSRRLATRRRTAQRAIPAKEN
jgi:hypothetical protein